MDRVRAIGLVVRHRKRHDITQLTQAGNRGRRHADFAQQGVYKRCLGTETQGGIDHVVGKTGVAAVTPTSSTAAIIRSTARRFSEGMTARLVSEPVGCADSLLMPSSCSCTEAEVSRDMASKSLTASEMLLWTLAAGACIPLGGWLASVERIRPKWLEQELRRVSGRPELARARLVVGGDGALLARVEGSQASSRIGSLQGADLLLEIPAELGALEAGTELWAQLLRLPVF